MHATGLDISDKTVRILEIESGTESLRVSKFGEEKLPDGVIELGEIKEEGEFIKILESLRKKHNLNYIIAAFPEEKSYILRIEMPPQARGNLKESIELALEEHIPLPANQVIFDYEIIKEPINKEDNFLLNISALPEALVSKYLKNFRAAGLTPLAFELKAQAQARAVIKRGDRGTFMIVDFADTRTGISIVHEGQVWFSTSINVGGYSVTRAIMKSFNISRDEAERIKLEKGVSKLAKNEGIYLSVLPTLSVLRDEINKHYNYWNTHGVGAKGREQKIEQVVMCGEDASLSGLTKFLTIDLGVTVSLADSWINVLSVEERIPPIGFGDSLKYISAIGLALRSQTL